MEELRAYFVGFMLLMGLYPKPPQVTTGGVTLSSTMPPLQIESPETARPLQRYLHFADNSLLHESGEPGYDRLGMVRPIIDEAMIPFQGRSSLKQYMPAKPVKKGDKGVVPG